MSEPHLFTSESVDRRPSRQGRRPDLRRRPRRHPRAGSARPRRLRDAGHDRPRVRRRRDHDRAPTSTFPSLVRQIDPRHRLHATRRTASTPTPAPSSPRSTTSRPTSRWAWTTRAGAGDQGLMFGYACRRDAGADAAADPAGAPARASAWPRLRKERQARLAAARRQVPGHGRVRGRQAGRASTPSSSRPSTPPDVDDCKTDPRGRRSSRSSSRSCRSAWSTAKTHEVPHQPDRPLRRSAARTATPA